MITETVRYISTKETAKLVRAQLKRDFPHTKFFVRLDVNSIMIWWIDGPTTYDVDESVEVYKGQYYDASIDTRFYNDAYLLPDGSYAPDTPDNFAPLAEKISFMTDYIFTRRSFSRALCERVAAEFTARSGWDAPRIGIEPRYVGRIRYGDRAFFERDPARDDQIREFNIALNNATGENN